MAKALVQSRSSKSASAPPPAADPEAWLNDHGDALYAYAMSRVHDPDTAEELVQETLLAAMGAYERFTGASTLRTWLIGILRHKILQHARPRGGASRVVASLDQLADGVDGQFGRRGKWLTSPGKWGDDPARVPESEEFYDALRRCLAKLPPRLAEAFVLSEQHRIGADGLESAMDASTSNVYVMLHRARSGLRACLERHWFGGAGRKGC